jgi:L-asparagine transporter-like permease
MPYVPYWFESFESWIPWIVPILSLIGLWIARLCDDERVRSFAEYAYYCAMILAAVITLRTIIADDHCWLLHTASFGMMVLGAVFPHHTHEADWSAIES